MSMQPKQLPRFIIDYDDLWRGYWIIDSELAADGEPCSVGNGAATAAELQDRCEALNHGYELGLKQRD